MERLLAELKQREIDDRCLNGKAPKRRGDARLLLEEVRLGLESRLKVEELRREFGLGVDADPLKGTAFYGDKR